MAAILSRPKCVNSSSFPLQTPYVIKLPVWLVFVFLRCNGYMTDMKWKAWIHIKHYYMMFDIYGYNSFQAALKEIAIYNGILCYVVIKMKCR